MSDPARFWRRSVWISLLVLLLSLLSLAPYLTSSTELVRMRHALLLSDSSNGGFTGRRQTCRQTSCSSVLRLIRCLSTWSVPPWLGRDAFGLGAGARHQPPSARFKPGAVGWRDPVGSVDTYRRIVGKGEGLLRRFCARFPGWRLPRASRCAPGLSRLTASVATAISGGDLESSTRALATGRYLQQLLFLSARACRCRRSRFAEPCSKNRRRCSLEPLHPGARPDMRLKQSVGLLPSGSPRMVDGVGQQCLLL
jgi:hypothetical protein